MNRKLFWISIFLSAFLVGVFGTAFWIFDKASITLNIDPVTLPQPNYVKSKIFPGLAKDFHSLEKSENEIFPRNTFQNFKDKWYSDQLHSMDERSIIWYGFSSYDEFPYEINEVYRFLWLRSFHRPIFVRIQKTGKGILLISKEMENINKPQSGKFVRLEYKILSQEQWQKFLFLLEKSQYWKLPTKEKYLPQDSAKWILEGVKKNRYHAVERTSPSDENFREACIYLLKLSSVDVDKLGDELY